MTQDNEQDGQKPDKPNRDHQGLQNLIFLVFGTLIAGTVGAISLWSLNHLVAILAIAAPVALVAIWQMRDYSRDKTVLAVMAIFAIGIFAYRVIGPVHELAKEEMGTLHPGSGPVANFSCGSGVSIPGSQPKILFGTNLYVATFSGKFSLITRSGDPIVWAENVGGDLKIGAKIFDRKGALIATINNNEFDVLTGDAVRMVRPDLSTIKVLDGNGTELLFLEFRNPTLIYLRGIFPYPEMQTVRITDDAILVGAKGKFAHNCSLSIPFLDLG